MADGSDPVLGDKLVFQSFDNSVGVSTGRRSFQSPIPRCPPHIPITLLTAAISTEPLAAHAPCSHTTSTAVFIPLLRLRQSHTATIKTQNAAL
jgi:hypothetical protein